jgi:hypothetical protein
MEITNPFTQNTYPNLFERTLLDQRTPRVTTFVPVKETSPARDVRYPAYVAAMSDGRYMTDYRPQCSKNIATGQQFQTKKWMIQHANEIMNESRRRHAEGSGASLPMSNTVPPPAARIYSTPFESEVQRTNLTDGIGVERANAAAPDLFGTFSYEPSIAELQGNQKRIQVTSRYEGGRNSIRGHF